MPRLVTFVDNGLLQNIKELSKTSGKSLSKTSAELMELGCKVKTLQGSKKNNEQEQKMTELIEKHTSFLLRILAINSDIFRCIRNEKSKYKGKETDDTLNTNKDEIEAYINGYIGKTSSF